MKKQTFNSFVSATVALLVFIVSIPLTTQALFRSIDDEGRDKEQVEDILKKAQNDVVRRRLNNRDYHRAVEIYRDMLNPERGGKDIDPATLTKPDMNDPKTWELYLSRDEKKAEDTHAAAKETKPAVMNDLSEHDQEYLRRTVKIGYCPDGLKKYVSGFYELCLSLTGKKGTAPKGILNDLAKLRAERKVLPKTLNNRLEMLRQAREGTKRESVGPSRTRTAAPTE